MKTHLIVASATAAALLSPPAHAQAGNRDVRCMMLSNLFARVAPAAQAKAAASQARIFYIGRVSAKYAPAQLQTAMAAEAKTIDIDRAGPEMNKCLATVEAGAAAVEDVGRKAQAANGAGTAKH